MRALILLALISYAFSAHAACGKKMEVAHQNQPTSYSCGPTALAMAMNYYGHDYTGEQVCSWLGNCNRSSGTDFSEMLDAADHFGFPEVHWRYGVDEMLDAIVADVTTVAIINVKAESYPMNYDGTPAFYSFTGGHYIEIHGVECDSDGNIKYYYVNDPAQPGWKDRKYTYSSMKNAWGLRDYRFLALKDY